LQESIQPLRHHELSLIGLCVPEPPHPSASNFFAALA